MSTDRDTTRIVRSWLEEGVTALPDRVLDTVLDRIPATSQRRPWWPAWRFVSMNSTMKLALAGAAIAVAVLVGISLLPRSPSIGAPSPTPVPLPTNEFALPAGAYVTTPFSGSEGMCLTPPQSGCTESALDDTIRFSFTLPDGWARAPVGTTIWRATEHNGPTNGAALMFNRGGWLHSQVCNPPASPDMAIGPTVDAFVTALVNHPNLDVTTPADVTLAGFSGKYLELRAPANIAVNQDVPTSSECPYYFVWEPNIYAQGPNQVWHLWVLDVGGVRVVVRTDTFPGTSAAVQSQLQAMVSSIKIQP